MLSLVLTLALSAAPLPPPPGISSPGKTWASLPARVYDSVRGRAWSAVQDLKAQGDEALCVWAMAALHAVNALNSSNRDSVDSSFATAKAFERAYSGAEWEAAMNTLRAVGKRGDTLELAKSWLQREVRDRCGPPNSPMAKKVTSALFQRAEQKIRERREMLEWARQAEPEKFTADGDVYTPSVAEAAIVMGGLLTPYLWPYIVASLPSSTLSGLRLVQP